MRDSLRRANRWDVREIRDYFREEISTVSIPALPKLSDGQIKSSAFGKRFTRIAAGVLTAAAFALLVATAGKGTRLSGSLDAALAGYDLRREITEFVIESGKIYRSELYGGSKQ